MEYIRQATVHDSKQILDIYAEYIKHTAYTFEIDVPSLDAFSGRVQTIAERYPYLVYVKDDRILGYAYASEYHERAAYCYTVDVSVYVERSDHGKGIGSKLYTVLFDLLEQQGYYNAFAIISVPNEKSVSLHRKFAFEEAGIHKQAGYKFDAWHDVRWMQKIIRPNHGTPRELLPVKTVLEKNGGIWIV